MSDEFDLAASLFGSKRLEASNERRRASETSTVYGTAVSDSADGSVQVVLDNGSVSAAMPDGTEGDNVLTLATSPAVKEGDTVLITAVGGTSKQMTVTAVVASGDRLRDTIADETWKTVIRNTDEGVVVGKSSDGGETFSGVQTLQGTDGFHIRDQDKITLTSVRYIDVKGTSAGKAPVAGAYFESDHDAIGMRRRESADGTAYLSSLVAESEGKLELVSRYDTDLADSEGCSAQGLAKLHFEPERDGVSIEYGRYRIRDDGDVTEREEDGSCGIGMSDEFQLMLRSSKRTMVNAPETVISSKSVEISGAESFTCNGEDVMHGWVDKNDVTAWF